jgi:DNA invertase Pin-like site-specific DNA recombinase
VRLVAALKPRPPFAVLLVTDRDRIGREQVEVSYLLKQIIAAGVRVFECQGAGREITLGSAVDKVILAVENFAAEVEREKARTRTYDAMAHRARAGRSTGGAAFGYVNRPIVGEGGRRSHVERIVESREAAVVERIFTLAAQGWGVKRIAGALNAEAAPAPMPRRAGRPRGWAPSSVREIFAREVYRGVLVWNKRKRDGWGQKRQRPREAPSGSGSRRPRFGSSLTSCGGPRTNSSTVGGRSTSPRATGGPSGACRVASSPPIS